MKWAILCGLILLAACTDIEYPIGPASYERAVALCKDDGGLLVIKEHFSGTYSERLTVMCANGARVSKRFPN